ncbi:hypothetical protein [Nonomuraea jabiensis]|uniref:hypothetical protein n=1 Tax=Nonomuraea jabiensis TaxID=882448 RepID=UPI003D74723E
MKTHEQLPVGGSEPVGGVQGESGFAHPGHPVDRADPHPTPGRVPFGNALSTCSISTWRPVNEATSRGKVCAAVGKAPTSTSL